MNKFLIFLFITTILTNTSFSMTEDEYWDTYADRVIKNTDFCLTEANKSSSFDDDIYDSCNNAFNKADKIRLEIIRKRQDQKCAAMREQIENSRGQSVGSNTTNFLMGMLNSYMEDEACNY
jgi:hypothetical protein